MIAYLEGEIIKKTEKGIILKTNDIGYLVHLGKSTIPSLKEGTKKEFFIHHHIKEDCSDLYGFPTFDELSFFQQLIAINGIGPKVGLEILSLPMEEVKAAILSDNQAFICKIPGIGKKTAQRLILELKDKVMVRDISKLKKHEQQADLEDTTKQEVMQALLQLGYKRHHISNMMETLPKEVNTTENIITYFIKNA